MPPETPQPTPPSPQPSLPGQDIAPVQPPTPQPVPVVTPAVPVPTPEPAKAAPKLKKALAISLLIILFIICNVTSYFVGKHGQKIVYKMPTPPPISLPAQAVVVADCVPGAGKQYVIPKDIPNGPIYDVENDKVIAVEYNYKALDLFTDPDKLSKTIVPFMRTYQIDHFVTDVGQLQYGSLAAAQSVPIHLVMYVVPQTEANNIKCPTAKTN